MSRVPFDAVYNSTWELIFDPETGRHLDALFNTMHHTILHRYICFRTNLFVLCSQDFPSHRYCHLPKGHFCWHGTHGAGWCDD